MVKSKDLVKKAQKLNKKRRMKSIVQDGIKNASKVYRGTTLTKAQYEKWKANKRRYDIDVVDGKGTYKTGKYYDDPLKVIRRIVK